MQKILYPISLVLLLSISLVFAHEHNFSETKKLIDSGISCNKLTDEQLEAIGEYYMEQMHPGESHELMHKMMGIEEGTEYHKQFHVNIARMIYCGDNNSGMMGAGMMSGGMMNMMMGMQNPMQTNLAQGMMGNLGYGLGYWNFLNVLYAILMIGLIILVYLGIVKLWKDIRNKGVKKWKKSK